MTEINMALLSARARNCLSAKGITTLEQVAAIPDYEFLRMPNIGRKTAKEIRRLAPPLPLYKAVSELVMKWGREAVADALRKVP